MFRQATLSRELGPLSIKTKEDLMERRAGKETEQSQYQEAASIQAVSKDDDSYSQGDYILVPMSRSALEREIIADVMALRDERLLSQLSEKERKELGDNPAGEIMYASTEEVVRGLRDSFSNGFWCRGTPGFTQGITCKAIRRRRTR
jgi:hypothetical protein